MKKWNSLIGLIATRSALLFPVMFALSGCTKVSFGTNERISVSDPKVSFGEAVVNPPGGEVAGGVMQPGGPGAPSGGGTPPPGSTPRPGATPPPEVPPSPTKGVFDFSTAVNRDNVWVVTNEVTSGNTTMHVYLFSLDASNTATLKKHWTVAGLKTTGARTYVSEMGLLIGKQGGQVFHVSEDHPEGTLSPIWSAPEANSGTRMCMTSFKLGSSAYIGAAWENAAGERVFTRAPIVERDGKKVADFNGAQSASMGKEALHGQTLWSYGCFTDPSRKQFWSGWGASSFFGVNYETMQRLDPAVHAPNANHSNSSLGDRFLNPAGGRNGNYALSGDARGNILTGLNVYTYAHDSRNNVVFGSHRGVDRMILAHADCFSTLATCDSTKLAEVDVSSIGRIGPISSLGDGRVIGIVRGTDSQVYVLTPNDPDDLSKLAKAVRVASVKGNAYMYSDFTGWSLESRNVDLTVEIDKIQGFVPGRPLAWLAFTWLAQGGGNAKWEGLILEARCYSNGAAPGAYERVTGVKDAGQATTINVSSCTGKVVDRLDLKVRPEQPGSAVFTRTSQIRVFGEQ